MLLPAVPGVYASYPVPGTTVYIDGDNGSAEVSANPDGTFLFDNELAEGEYMLYLFVSGFLEKTVVLSVTAGSTTNLGDIMLEQSAIIQGQVTGPSGEPVPSAYLYLYNQVDDSVVNTAFANSSGYYAFDWNVPTGTYYILMLPRNDVGNGYLEEYVYGISATQGSTTTVDIQLEMSASISGTIMLDPSTPTKASVTLTNATGDQIAHYYTDSTGKYNFSWGVPAGTYNVSAFNVAGGIWSDSQVLQVSVGAGEQSPGNDLVYDRSASISGTVTYEGGAPAPYAYVYWYSSTHYTGDGMSTNSDGHYTFDSNVLPGDYMVRAGTIRTVSQNIVITAEGEAKAGVDFTIPQQGDYAWITGMIAEGSIPISDAMVLAHGMTNPYAYSSANGSYTITANLYGVGTPSTFNVTAWKPGYYISYQHPVVVNNGSTTTGVNFNLTAIPTGSVSGRVVSNVASSKQDASLSLMYSY